MNLDQILKRLAGIPQAIGNQLGNQLSNFGRSIPNPIAAPIQAVQNIPQQIGNTFGNIGGNVHSSLDNIYNQARQNIQNTSNYLNPNVGYQPPPLIRPTGPPTPAPLRSFWTDIPQIQKDPIQVWKDTLSNPFSPSSFYPAALAQGRTGLPRQLDPISRPIGQFGSGFIEGGTSAGLLDTGSKPQNVSEEVAREAGKYLGMFMPYSLPAKLMGGGRVGVKALLKESALGAPVNVGLQGIFNTLEGKDFLHNADLSAKQGFDMSAQLGPLSAITNKLGGPLLNKVANPKTFERTMIGKAPFIIPLKEQGFKNAVKYLTREGLADAIPFSGLTVAQTPGTPTEKAQAGALSFAQAFALGTGVKLTSAATGQVYNGYKEIVAKAKRMTPEERHKFMNGGFIRIPGADNQSNDMKKLQFSNLDETVKRIASREIPVTPPSPTGVKLPASEVLVNMRNKSPQAVEVFNKVNEWASRNSKTFKQDKFSPYLGYAIDKLGPNEVLNSFETHANKLKPSIADFNTDIKSKIALQEKAMLPVPGATTTPPVTTPVTPNVPISNVSIPSMPIPSMPIPSMPIPSMPKNPTISDILTPPTVPQVPVKPTVSNPIPTNPVNPTPIASVLTPKPTNIESPLLSHLPDPKTIKTADAHVSATDNGYGILNQKIDKIKSFADQSGLDPVTIGKVWDKEIPAPNKSYSEAVSQLQNLYNEVYDIRSKKGAIGYIDKMPHVFNSEVNNLDTFFTKHSDISPILDELMSDSHRLHRSGTGIGYIDNPFDALKISGTTAIQDYLKPFTDNQRAIIAHVNKLEPNTPTNYLDLLRTEPPTKVVDYQVHGSVPQIKSKDGINEIISNPIKQRYNIMSHVGGELESKYKNLVESFDFKGQQVNEVKNLDGQDLINYFAKIVKPDDVSGYNQQANWYLNKFGKDAFISKQQSRLTRSMAEDFMATAKQYSFKDPNVERVVNGIIDDYLKTGKSQQNLGDQVFHTVSRVFSLAQIGGNIKVVASQLLDTLRLPANFSFSEIGTGFKKSLSEFSTLEKKYGFQESHLAYKSESPVGRIGEMLAKIPEALYIPLKESESFKNKIFIGAAEAQGIKKGLSGPKLTRYVRDTVFRTANIAHKENTPLFLKNSALTRSLLQYSQFSLKNVIELSDAVGQKEYKKAFTLGATNLLGTVMLATAFGIPLKYALSQVLPTGPGPILSLPWQLIQEAQAYITKDEQNRPTLKESALLKDTIFGSLVPVGSQINKSRKGFTAVNQGYAEQADGKIKYPVEQSVPNYIRGIIGGTNMLPENKAFFDKGSKPLSDNESLVYKATPDKQGYYKDIQDNIKSKNEADKIIRNIEAGSGSTDTKDEKVKKLLETYQISKAKERVNNGGKSEQIGNYIIHEDPTTGEAKATNVDTLKKHVSDSQYSLDAQRLLRDDNLSGWLDTTQKHIDTLKEYESKLTDKADEADRINTQNKIEDLQTLMEKYKGYGGFKKGSRAGKKKSSKALNAIFNYQRKLNSLPKYHQSAILPRGSNLDRILSRSRTRSGKSSIYDVIAKRRKSLIPPYLQASPVR